MSVPSYPVYLFDVDGTLVDSATDICGAVQSVLAKTDCSPRDFDFLKSYIGRHLNDLWRDIWPEIDQARMDALLADYRTIYHARGHCGTSMYPYVAETLATLGGRKSTATTKATTTVRIVLEKFGLLPYFDHVQGTDGFPAKPEPDVILKCIEAMGVRPEDCLMVGDSPADMEAGRRAGVKTCGVRYGYGRLDLMAAHNPDYWIDDIRELL